VLELLVPSRCPVCRRSGASPCSRCTGRLPAPPALPPPAGVDACVAATAYSGAGRDLVHALKFRLERAPAAWVAAVVAGRLDVATLDVVTWVPTSPARARRRGADHAERLARAVARAVGLPVRRLLVRGPGPPQAGRDAPARRDGPRLAAARRCPAGVLVVDDVVTTGASVAAAARALRAAGAQRVVVACAARTPTPSG